MLDASNAKMNSSEQGKRICSYCIDWYDGCDPNSSTKQNRGSVWVKTITFGAPRKDRNSFHHTYVIAVGPDHVGHRVVEEQFQQELEYMKQQDLRIYSKAHCAFVSVHMELMATLADQPARREANWLSHGNGTYGARFGVAADLHSLMVGVPACEDCLNALYNGEADTCCAKCTNWRTDIDDPLLDMPPPKNYPVSELPASGKLRPLAITYDTLKAAVQKTHDKVVAAEWTRPQAEAYLLTQGFNWVAIKEIYFNAENTKLHNE